MHSEPFMPETKKIPAELTLPIAFVVILFILIGILYSCSPDKPESVLNPIEEMTKVYGWSYDDLKFQQLLELKEISKKLDILIEEKKTGKVGGDGSDS